MRVPPYAISNIDSVDFPTQVDPQEKGMTLQELRYLVALADKGWRRALDDDPHLRNGLNVHDGKLTYRAVAEALKLPYTPAEEVLRG